MTNEIIHKREIAIANVYLLNNKASKAWSKTETTGEVEKII